jgi:hypothetical protein
MEKYKEWLDTLKRGPHVTKDTLHAVPRQQGAYVLWLDSNPPRCLKVGIAGPRNGKGLWGRITFHFSSNPNNTVLARHMAADSTSEWSREYDFSDQGYRRIFLATCCFFQTIGLPNLTRSELEGFERFLEQTLLPPYSGQVGG